MRTTATYDINSKKFILHTPDFEAAKCWVGSLGNNNINNNNNVVTLIIKLVWYKVFLIENIIRKIEHTCNNMGQINHEQW